MVIPTPPDFSFHETVSSHGWLRLSPFVWHDHAPPEWTDWRPPPPPAGGSTGILERTLQLHDGKVVLLRIRDAVDGVGVDVAGNDSGHDTEVVQCVRRMLQLDIDITPFQAFASRHAALAHVAERKLGRVLRAPTLFEDVVKVICTTNTTWSQTKGMVSRIVDEFGAPSAPEWDNAAVRLSSGGRATAASPNLDSKAPQSSEMVLRAFPTPQSIASVSAEEFAARTRLGYRSASVHGLAQDIADGRLDLEAWQAEPLTAAELETRLLGLRGVGPYAAACLLLYLGKPTRVTVDSWARTRVGKEMGRAVSDKEVREFFDIFGEWRGLAYYFYGWTA